MSFTLKILHSSVDYFRNSNIKCFKYFVSTDRPLIERIIWFIAAICWISVTVWLVSLSYTYVQRAPTVTSEMSTSMSIVDIPFPAVALCSENRISRRKLLEYSMFILNSTGYQSLNGDTVSEIADSLLLLGKMYNMDASEADFYRMDQLHSVLLQAYDGAYPFPEILANLTPDCDELLERCKWAGGQVNCSSIFHSRRTSFGMCCTFNYLRPSPDLLREQFSFNGTITIGEPVRVTKHGHDFGLMVLINQRTDDYAFSINSNIGCRILIFDTRNFPDNISGAIKEKFLSIGEEMFLSINARPNVGSNGLRKYSKELRNCVFSDEISLIYENFYSLSECLLTCRLTDISRFCGCIPPQFLNIIPNENMCLLNDMPCLTRWKLKWFNLEPNEHRNALTLDLHCPGCLPMCNFVKFNVESSTSNFASDVFTSSHVDRNFTLGIHDANYSIINVNFASKYVKVYDQSPLFTWYELLAGFGGMATLTLGASFINIAEIFYFATGKFGGQAVGAPTCTHHDATTLLEYPKDFWKQPELRNKYYRRKRLTVDH